MYVDDFLITGNNNDHIFQVKQELQTSFEMTDLGLLKSASVGILQGLRS